MLTKASCLRRTRLPLLKHRPDIDLVGEASFRLGVQIPVRLRDVIRIDLGLHTILVDTTERFSLFTYFWWHVFEPFLSTSYIYHAVDDCMRNMNALWSKFSSNAEG